MTQGQKSNLYVTLLIGVFFYISVTYNACSDVEFSQEKKLSEKIEKASIVINNGDKYTRDINVNLTLYSPFAKEMFVSNSSDCSTGTWEPYSENKVWELNEDNTNVAVYVKYKFDGDESDCSHDDIIHDDIIPEVAFMNKQDTFINTNSLNVQYSVNDSGSGINKIECSLNPNANFKPCDTNVALQQLIEGQHNFFVKVSDKAGNQTPPLDYRWTVDVTKPVVVLNKTPLKIDNRTTAEFEFVATDAISGIDKIFCDIDGSGFAECTSPFSKTALTEDTHKFKVKATDLAGNESDVVEYEWRIDTTAPTVTITKHPLPITNDANATFEFEGKDGNTPISDFECKFDNEAFAACTSPLTRASLSDGTHTFYVRGKDGAGNFSSPAQYSWLIDTVPPTITFVQKPNTITTSQSATFQMDAQDSGSGIDRIECKLDAGDYAACNSATTLNNLAKGTHTFSARAIDKAGNMSQPISHTWSIDLDKPVVTITKTPNPYTKDSTAEFEFQATDVGSGVAGYECRLDGGNYEACTSPKNYNSLTEGSHTFFVRAKDNAGNISDPAQYTWVIDVTPPVITFIKYPTTLFERDNAVIFFTSTDSGSGVDTNNCLYDQATTNNCQSDMDLTFANQQLGNHTFKVTATDRAGNSASAQITWEVNLKTISYSEEKNLAANKKVDILFVVDTSGSMEEEMRNMSQKINNFLDKISDLDWQIAVTTTDDRANRPGGDGKLAETDLGGKIIYKTDANAQDNLSRTIDRPVDRYYAKEVGIYNTYRSIERFENSAAENNDHRVFFRDAANFAVILLSDEDENSNGTNLDPKSVPQNLVDKVQTKWPKKNFVFSSIVWRPNDDKSACSTGSNKGVKYAELTELTDGILGSICASDYTEILKDMGDKVVSLQKSIALQCDPVDANKDGQPDLTIYYKATAGDSYTPYMDTYTISGMKINFDNLLPDGFFQLDYTCRDPN